MFKNYLNLKNEFIKSKIYLINKYKMKIIQILLAVVCISSTTLLSINKQDNNQESKSLNTVNTNS